MTINKKQVNDAKNFEALCAEITAQSELDSLKLKDEKIYFLLNEYYSKRIYPNFAFIAQTNDKSEALSCLGRLKYFKTVVSLCAAIESFKLPESLPYYLLHDFRAKIDYINNLTAAGDIADESILVEFEAVIMSLRSLYEEKKRHESSFQSAGDEILLREQMKSQPEKPRIKKKTVASEEEVANINKDEKGLKSEKQNVISVNAQPGAKKKKEKSRIKRFLKTKSGMATNKSEADTVEKSGIASDKARKKLFKKIYEEKSSKAPKDIETYIVMFTAFAFMVAGAAVYARGDKASTFGAFIGGVFGAFFGSLIVDTIYFTKVEYFIRDALACLFLMILAVGLFVLNIY